MSIDSLPRYLVRKTEQRPQLDGDWDSPIWQQADTLAVTHFHSTGSDHRPRVQARMLYDADALYGLSRVEDRYVICTHTGYLTHVYKDSCVEFFVRPKPDKGYMNFEMNCGGGLLLYYIADCTPKRNPDDPDDEFVDFTKVPSDIGSRVRRYHSMASRIFPEIKDDIEWRVEFHIPLSVLETYVGALGPLSGQEWRANFYKCADDSSHPHWGAWSPVGEAANFHNPSIFGILCFE